MTSHNDGVWVVCVHHTSVTSNCYAEGPVKKLYRRGQGPAPECHNIYNSPQGYQGDNRLMSSDVLGIPRLDLRARPRWKTSLLWWMGGWFVATRFGGKLWRTVLSPLDAPIMRLTKGRVRIVGLPVVRLTTTGARTKQPRDSMLAYFTDGDDVIVVASNWGQGNRPGWYYNLIAHPECELHIGPQGGQFMAREINGAERDELYRLTAERLSRSWTTYEQRVDRTIPMMRLTPCPT